jgi:hypothetical protein
MPKSAVTPVYSRIPVQLTKREFKLFILPHLSMPTRGPHCKIGYWKMFNYILKILYTGMQWKELPIGLNSEGKPEIHYTVIYKKFAQWSDDKSIDCAFVASVQFLSDTNKLDVSILNGDGSNTVAKKGGDGIGYSGHKHQKGEKVVAIVDAYGHVISPFTIAPVNTNDCILLPNIPENKRNRKRTKPGPKRKFNENIHQLRLVVKRTFAWEDKFKILVLRFERIQSRHFSFKLLAYALINLRSFCQA